MQSLYAECYELTHGGFALVAFTTNSLRSKNQLNGFAQPSNAPAQALGWLAGFIPYRLFNAIKDTEIAKPTVETLPVKRYEWATIVTQQDAEAALPVVLREALKHIKLIQMRATGEGASV